MNFINDLPRGSCTFANEDGKRVMHGFYQAWKGMRFRTKDIYKDATVCDEWRTLSKFKEWFDGHFIEGYQLDKDLMSATMPEKLYSPETCVYIPRELNLLFTDRGALRGDLPMGVNWVNRERYGKNRFRAAIQAYSKTTYIGCYSTPEEAHAAYRKAKLAYCRQLAADWLGKVELKAIERVLYHAVRLFGDDQND